jgi:beta-N-acetylhexosaminidase
MRSRSFGSSPNRVGNLVRDFAHGLQRSRVAAAAKHFPGLGGATVNSDFGRAYVYRNKWKLHNIDAIPFRKAIAGGIRMMMLSHGIYVKDGGKRPASINRYIAVTRLRKELSFTGVAISDALEAVAWRFGDNTARACRATIWAGSDIALITGDVHAARACAAEIVEAVRSGAIPRARLDAAVLRVLQLKKWLGLL